jgi:hypothetical protein
MVGFNPGDGDQAPFERVVWTVWNRTGNPTVEGRLYQFDTRLSTSAASAANLAGKVLPAVSDYSKGDIGAFGNIVHIETAATLSGDVAAVAALKYCLAIEAKPNFERVKVLVCGTYQSYTAYYANSAAAATFTAPVYHRLYAGPSTTNGGAFALGIGTEVSATYSYNQALKPPIAVGFGSTSIAVNSASASVSATYGMFFDGWNYIPSRL